MEIATRPKDLIAFQWGYCPSRLPWEDLFYRIGDALRWRLDDEGRIRPWVYFKGALQAGNIGDPLLRDLLVRGLHLNGLDIECAACGASGVAIRIRDGRIVGLEAARADCDVAVVGRDGQIHPRPDLDDPPMPILEVRSRVLATCEGTVIPGIHAP
ncbi:hypothetical protein [Polyangium fumosum]|uniref:Uncharacterized protein n=1 Tax=Polyangium fumosum TaxID=889272 RepID=A0A4V5PKJ4_9BACT|nr:hypothetical protein [Polyangium fumosum]TKC95794.1 hypothetical protein E8A74_46610 [Polyangium fumosum]